MLQSYPDHDPLAVCCRELDRYKSFLGLNNDKDWVNEAARMKGRPSPPADADAAVPVAMAATQVLAPDMFIHYVHANAGTGIS